MSFPYINAYQQFFDSSGDPLISGTIEFRSPTTNDLIDSFPTADDADAQTNANDNPLTLSSTGAASSGLFLEDGVAYKVILKDSAGATIATHDDVRCPISFNLQTATESAAGVTPSDLSYPPGNVRRYGATGDGSTDDATAFQSALNSGHQVIVPITSTNNYIVGTALTGTDGGSIVGESRDTRITYTGTAGTYLFTGTRFGQLDLKDNGKGFIIDNLSFDTTTVGANCFYFEECRNVSITRFNIIPGPSDQDWAICILFDDSATTSPQRGSAWNYVNDYWIEGASDAGIRLDTQGTLAWCNRNYIGFGHIFKCAIGLDLGKAATNMCIGVNPQNCTTGVNFQAGADYNVLLGYEEASTTNSVALASGANRNAIYGNWSIADKRAITGATKANPCVVTAVAHGFSDGDSVNIYNVFGMTELNGNTYTVASAATDTFALSATDSSGYTTYVSGGEAWNLVGGISDSGSNTTWISADYIEIPSLQDGTLTLDPASGNANILVPAGSIAGINFTVRSSADAATTVVSFPGNQVTPYASIPNAKFTTSLKLPTYTTAELTDVADDVNTNALKVEGACVFDTTANIPMYATGAADASTWVGEKAGATVTVSPVP